MSRSAGSLARAPNDTDTCGSTRAVAVLRAGLVPASPLYQNTVLLVVPGTNDVAVLKGGPFTRIGGLDASVLKKSLPAATAEAATSDVSASFVTAVVNAA